MIENVILQKYKIRFMQRFCSNKNRKGYVVTNKIVSNSLLGIYFDLHFVSKLRKNIKDSSIYYALNGLSFFFFFSYSFIQNYDLHIRSETFYYYYYYY